MSKGPKTRRVLRKGTFASVREESFLAFHTTTTGFGFTSQPQSDGSTLVTRRQMVELKPAKKARKDLGKVGSIINASKGIRKVRAHSIADQFGGPASKRNITFTSQEANQLDCFAEAKMKTRMRGRLKIHPGSKFFMSVTEKIDASGARVKKDTVLQRQGSFTQFSTTVVTNDEP